MSQFRNCKFYNPNYNFDINLNTPQLDVFGSTEYGPEMSFHRPLRTKYDDFLEGCGIEYPKFPQPHCGFYFDINGNLKRANPNFPWMLVTYAPRKMEKLYQTLERAMIDVPSSITNGTHFRVINTMNGQIAYERGANE